MVMINMLALFGTGGSTVEVCNVVVLTGPGEAGSFRQVAALYRDHYRQFHCGATWLVRQVALL